MRTYAVSRILICIETLYYADDSSSHKPQLLCSGINRCEERLALSDYLHEKAAESRHNETQAYLLIIVGVVLFSVGLLKQLWQQTVQIGFCSFHIALRLVHTTFWGCSLR